jgi:uracil-DNA glycosylase family 4
MVIGETPTKTENLGGKGGKLLLDLLENAGIDKKDVYFTNVVKCTPPEGRSPSASEVKTCKVYLDEEIATVKPEYILTLGATVLKALSKKSKITEQHGQAFDYKGSSVIPSFAPNMALRDPTRLPGLRKDIVKFGNTTRGAVATTEDMHWEVIRTIEQWNEFIGEFEASHVIGADIETTGLDCETPEGNINSIQFSLDATDKNWALPLWVMWSPWAKKPKMIDKFMNTLLDLAEDKTIVGQNFKFDNRWIQKKYGRSFKLSFDTMLAHHLIDENSPHGLKELASEFCNAPSYDIPLRIKLGQFENRDEEEKFYKYGCFDTNYCRQLYYIFRKPFLKDKTQRRLFYKLVMPAARLFEQVESSGHFINRKRMKLVRDELNKRKQHLLTEMNKFCSEEVNWNSPAQVGKLFYEDLGLPILEKTDGGAPSTGESVLLRLQHEHELPKLLMEFRGVDKNLSTYVEGWEKLMHGDYLFMSTKLHGTVTGRYASRLHQVPRDPMIRSLIDAPPGWTFVCADYSQIELRIAALLSNDHRMKMIFQTGGDIHTETAAFILGKRPQDLTKEERKMAKAVNFGLLYGMGWPKLIIYARDNYGVTMTEHQAKAFRVRYFETYNALPKWHERQRRCVRAFGQVVSPSGRIRHLPGIESSDQGVRAEAERQGINSPVQGFGSGDLKAMAMVEVSQSFDWDSIRIKGEVHDSILMWIKTELLRSILPQIKEIMEAPSLLADFGVNMTVPLVADFEIGAWGNGKKVLFDKHGEYAGLEK